MDAPPDDATRRRVELRRAVENWYLSSNDAADRRRLLGMLDFLGAPARDYSEPDQFGLYCEQYRVCSAAAMRAGAMGKVYRNEFFLLGCERNVARHLEGALRGSATVGFDELHREAMVFIAREHARKAGGAGEDEEWAEEARDADRVYRTAQCAESPVTAQLDSGEIAALLIKLDSLSLEVERLVGHNAMLEERLDVLEGKRKGRSHSRLQHGEARSPGPCPVDFANVY